MIVRLSLLLLLVVPCFIFSGCDDLLNEKVDDRKRELELREEIARKEEECNVLRKTLDAGVLDKLKDFESTLPTLTGKESELAEDSRKLVESIQTAMDRKTAKGGEPKYEVKVLNALKDETVNGLAMKYLGADFSLIRDGFIEDVRTARTEESRYRKAIADADADYEAAEQDTKKWVQMTKSQRDSEIARLKKDIVSLETKWNSTRQEVKNLPRHSMQGNARQERERREKGWMMENRMRDIQSEIEKKRYQLDSLTHPESAMRVEQRAGDKALDLRSSVNYAHRERLRTIEQNMKPKRTVTDIVQDCEKKTLEKLRQTIAQALEETLREHKALREKIKTLKDIRVSLPSADFHMLQRLREKYLAL